VRSCPPPPDFRGQGWIKVDELVRAILGGMGEMDVFYI
jgi:hypothetical protein